jgi:hypothetical protein
MGRVPAWPALPASLRHSLTPSPEQPRCGCVVTAAARISRYCVPAEHQTEIWCSPRAKAVVDGVLDGGRQANGRTIEEQADGKHQILGREQHRRTTGHQTDDQHQTTDLAVGGSNPSRRATKTAAQRSVARLGGADRSLDCDQITTTSRRHYPRTATNCDHEIDAQDFDQQVCGVGFSPSWGLAGVPAAWPQVPGALSGGHSFGVSALGPILATGNDGEHGEEGWSLWATVAVGLGSVHEPHTLAISRSFMSAKL